MPSPSIPGSLHYSIYEGMWLEILGWGAERWDTLSLDGERASHLPAPFLSNTFLLIQQSKSRVGAREKLGGEGRQAN